MPTLLRIAVACLAGLSLAACGARGAAMPGTAVSVSRRDVVERDAARTPLVYVADHANNLIDVFDRGGQLQYTITNALNAPAGLFVDTRHNLWVANPGADDVLVFPRGSTMPSETLDDTNRPNDVAVSNNGTAFVADSLNVGGVAVYPPGHTMPTRRLEAQQSGAGGIEFYVTCDEAGNVFATGYIGLSPFPATTGWRHGRESGYYLLPQDAWSSSGIKATAAGALLIVTSARSKPAVVEFTEAGKRTGKAIETGSNPWGDIALSAKGSVVFGVDTPRDDVVARKFPSGAHRHTYANGNLGQPEGVAVDPGD